MPFRSWNVWQDAETSPPAAFSRRSEAQHTAQCMPRLFALCGLAAELFERPADVNEPY